MYRERERSCDGKIRYGSEGEARVAARQVARHNGNHKFSIYRCRFCLCYHFGHRRKYRGRQQRLAAARQLA